MITRDIITAFFEKKDCVHTNSRIPSVLILLLKPIPPPLGFPTLPRPLLPSVLLASAPTRKLWPQHHRNRIVFPTSSPKKLSSPLPMSPLRPFPRCPSQDKAFRRTAPVSSSSFSFLVQELERDDHQHFGWRFCWRGRGCELGALGWYAPRT